MIARDFFTICPESRPEDYYDLIAGLLLGKEIFPYLVNLPHPPP